jgi:hypothetical protein
VQISEVLHALSDEAEGSVDHEEPAGQWAREADKAVATAGTAGTAAAWRSAAQAAVVVADIAQTMRVTTHAHEIVEQLAVAFEEAAEQAQMAQQAVDDALRMAEHTTQAAEEAAQAAQVAFEIAADARQKAEQAALEAPEALESAELAAQAVAQARATADQLDQIVIKAREANTPEAWSEALQIATETYGDGESPHIASAR